MMLFERRGDDNSSYMRQNELKIKHEPYSRLCVVNLKMFFFYITFVFSFFGNVHILNYNEHKQKQREKWSKYILSER